jgi:hypothetical protein
LAYEKVDWTVYCLVVSTVSFLVDEMVEKKVVSMDSVMVLSMVGAMAQLLAVLKALEMVH